MRRLLVSGLMVMMVGACKSTAEGGEGKAKGPASAPAAPVADSTLAPPPPEGMAVATFAGGCFWCMEPPFEKLEGVKAVYSGYAGGPERNPTYKQVSHGTTGHTEAVRVIYDPKAVSYDKLLDTFWRSMDPTDAGGQFVDRGAQYRPAIFTHTPEQRAAAEESKAALQASGRFSDPIIVPIQDAGPFWLAEDYHQDFYKKSPDHYHRYRSGSGRDRFIEETWGK
jgi:peptide methionine sulfoxide reductase msrA/msrB